MKNYEEITNNLLERRDRYVVELNRKRKRMMGTATSLCCCCLVSFIGLGIWHTGKFDSQPPVILEDSIIIGEKDYISPDEPENVSNTNAETAQTPNNIEKTDNSAKNNEIRILEIEKLPNIPEKMFIALMCDDFIPMDHDKINEYYGVNIFPTLPGDLESKDNQALGIYRRKTNGELYYDGNKISYTNADYSRGIAVNVDKNGLPFDFCNLFANIQTRSIINDVEVGIVQSSIGDMYAEFMYQNVGFRIYAYGLTQDEFVSVVESLLP